MTASELDSDPPVGPPAPGRVRGAVRAVRDLGSLGPLAVFFVAMPAVGAVVLGATHQDWQPALEQASGGPWVWFVAIGALLCAGSLVPTHAVSLVGGMFFGGWVGSLTALLAVALACLLGFALLRGFARARFEHFMTARPRARAIHDALVGRSEVQTAGLLALLRLSPAMPFAATNLLMSAARLPLWVYFSGSVVGLAPRVVAVAVAGSGLARLDLAQARDRWILVAGAVATVVALVVIGRIARRAWVQATA